VESLQIKPTPRTARSGYKTEIEESKYESPRTIVNPYESPRTAPPSYLSPRTVGKYDSPRVKAPDVPLTSKYSSYSPPTKSVYSQLHDRPWGRYKQSTTNEELDKLRTKLDYRFEPLAESSPRLAKYMEKTESLRRELTNDKSPGRSAMTSHSYRPISSGSSANSWEKPVAERTSKHDTGNMRSGKWETELSTTGSSAMRLSDIKMPKKREVLTVTHKHNHKPELNPSMSFKPIKPEATSPTEEDIHKPNDYKNTSYDSAYGSSRSLTSKYSLPSISNYTRRIQLPSLTTSRYDSLGSSTFRTSSLLKVPPLFTTKTAHLITA